MVAPARFIKPLKFSRGSKFTDSAEPAEFRPAKPIAKGGTMPVYRSLFPRDVFAELDHLQREMQQALDLSPNIRGLGRGGFPALNVGGTA